LLISSTAAASFPLSGSARESVPFRSRQAEAIEPHACEVATPDAGVWRADLRIFRRDDDVGAERHVGAAAHAPPVHLRDHRLGAAPQAHELGDRPRERARGGNEIFAGIPAALRIQHVFEVTEVFRKIEPGAKRPSRPAQNDHAYLTVAVRLDDRVLDLVGHGWDNGIQPLRTVQGNRRHCAAPLIQDRLVGHLHTSSEFDGTSLGVELSSRSRWGKAHTVAQSENGVRRLYAKRGGS
jgi:hypothetical protein